MHYPNITVLYAGISGERIWVEVKKIAIGRYADDIFRIMAELGVTNYIGWSANSFLFTLTYFHIFVHLETRKQLRICLC